MPFYFLKTLLVSGSDFFSPDFYFSFSKTLSRSVVSSWLRFVVVVWFFPNRGEGKVGDGKIFPFFFGWGG